jgi:hypothetical protein
MSRFGGGLASMALANKSWPELRAPTLRKRGAPVLGIDKGRPADGVATASLDGPRTMPRTTCRLYLEEGRASRIQ